MIERIDRFIRSDDGVTLAELMFVLGILGFVLAAAWAGNFAISKAFEITQRQGAFAHDVADPMEQMSGVLMQSTTPTPTPTAISTGIDVTTRSPSTNAIAPGNYQLGVWTKRGNTVYCQLNQFIADSTGKLTWKSWNYDPTTLAYSVPRVWVMSTTNGNVAAGTPMFTYYDISGNAVALASNQALAPTVKSVKVTVKVNNPGGGTMTGSRSITFRN